MKSCATCKFLSKSREHLNDYLRSLPIEHDWNTCLAHSEKPKLLYFTSTWLFHIIKNESVCALHNYKPRSKEPVQLSMF
jgi:hypothetical protein